MRLFYSVAGYIISKAINLEWGISMSRQVNQYEKIFFDVIKDYNQRFYYEGIFKVFEEEDFKIKLEKPKEEMVGHAYVTTSNGSKIDYEIRYNRITNLSEGYTLFVPSIQAG